MSANALAMYMVASPDLQETILHDARYSRPPKVTANRDAISGLIAYNVDPLRDTATLEGVKAALSRKAAHAETMPRARDEAKRCIEAIERFQCSRRCETDPVAE